MILARCSIKNCKNNLKGYKSSGLCNKHYTQKYRKDNPNFVKEQLRRAREKHAKNPEIRLAQWKNWRINHRDEILQKQLEEKLEVLTHYSKVISNSTIPCCRCCGENSHIEFLAIDHIAGKKEMDSEPELVKLGYSSLKRTVGLHKWIIENNFPKGFQILCHNCNYAKGIRRNNNKCPHQK